MLIRYKKIHKKNRGFLLNTVDGDIVLERHRLTPTTINSLEKEYRNYGLWGKPGEVEVQAKAFAGKRGT